MLTVRGFELLRVTPEGNEREEEDLIDELEDLDEFDFDATADDELEVGRGIVDAVLVRAG